MATVRVSVTPSSSSKTTDAYAPNPVHVNVGDTVIWTNDDRMPHTATSGIPGHADGVFGGEAGSFGTILVSGKSQQVTFNEAGQFAYHCGLHPNMAGIIIVGEKQTATRPQTIDSSMKVFISYSTKDKVLANRLYDELRDRDFSVWIDRVEMRPGDSLPKKIKQGITAADALLVLVTRNSIKSTWVRKEVRMAIAKEKKKGGPRVIPLVVSPSKIPKNLKAKLYLEIKKCNLKLPEILGALYPESYILRINLRKKDLTVDEDSIRTGLHEYYRRPNRDVRVFIDNHDFNRRIMTVIKKSLEDKEMPEMAAEQIKHGGNSLPVTLPIFWTSLSSVLQQLVTDLFTNEDRDLGTLETAVDGVIATMEYSLSSLGHELGYTVFPSYAESIGYYDIADFMGRHKRKDWHDFFRERLGLNNGEDLGAVDLVGKKGIWTTRIRTPLSQDDMLDLQGSGLKVELSPAGLKWYSEYLPQIIGRELKIIALRRGKLLQKGEYVIGLHMDDYEKAGLG